MLDSNLSVTVCYLQIQSDILIQQSDDLLFHPMKELKGKPISIRLSCNSHTKIRVFQWFPTWVRMPPKVREKSGVNFTNVLQADFAREDPKAQKDLTVFL